MGFGSWRLRLSAIWLLIDFVLGGGVGILAAEVMGLDAEIELESERRGSTAASPSWFTSADMSMVDVVRVVLRLTIDLVLTSDNAKRFSPCGSLTLFVAGATTSAAAVASSGRLRNIHRSP